MKYGSPDLVENEEVFFAGAEGDPQIRGLLYRPRQSTGSCSPYCTFMVEDGWRGQPT